MSKNAKSNENNDDLASLQREVDEEFDLNNQNIFGPHNLESTDEMRLIENFVTSDMKDLPISKNPPKYKLIEPSILFEFWGHKVLDSYQKQTKKIISLFQRRELKVPKELEEQLSFLQNKIAMLESSIQNGQMSEEQYKRSLINAINRELSELPCRALEDFNEFEQNIICILEELMTFFDNEEEDINDNGNIQSPLKNKEEIFNLLQIPNEFFLTNEEKEQFWGTFVLIFYLRLVCLCEKVFESIDSNHILPNEIEENKSYCSIELKKIETDTKSGKISPAEYLEMISGAYQREKAKKGALLPPQKHRINILEKELNQIKQYMDGNEDDD